MIELLNIIALMCGMNAICHKYYMNCMENWTPQELVQCTKERTNFKETIYEGNFRDYGSREKCFK